MTTANRFEDRLLDQLQEIVAARRRPPSSPGAGRSAAGSPSPA